MKKIRIGHKFRYIPKNYFELVKNEGLMEFNWCKPEENPNDIVLAGEYRVVDIKKNFFIFCTYKLDIINEWVNLYNFVLSSSVDLCPFSIGDEVIFKPKCLNKELEVFYVANPTIKINKKYIVVNIINDYYVIINTPFFEEWREYTPLDRIKDESIPIRWIDLEKV